MKIIKEFKSNLSKEEESELHKIENELYYSRDISYRGFNKNSQAVISINGKRSWNFIPYRGSAFILQSVKNSVGYKRKKLRLLDVGCGVGNIIKIAEKIGYKAEGIEYQKIYVDNAIVSKKKIHNVDAFEFTNYNNYDVIYAYMPLYKPKDMKKLLSFINKQLTKNQILIFIPASHTLVPKSFHRIYGTVWQRD